VSAIAFLEKELAPTRRRLVEAARTAVKAEVIENLLLTPLFGGVAVEETGVEDTGGDQHLDDALSKIEVL
jgi:hypothetical protein